MSRMSGIILDRILWHLDSLTWSLKEKGRRIREVFRKQDNYIPEYYNRSPPEESRLRILVLGAKGSGKSTFFKQMRILHHGGIPEEERRTYTSDIYRHVLKSVEEVLLVIRELGLEYADEESLVNQISEYSEIDSTTSLSPEIVSEIHRFWRNLMVESVVEQHGSWEEHFEDNGDHFLSQITRIGSPDYIPTEQDILFARTSKATGVLETSFSIEDNS
ncbi:hypothetical protein D9758_005792 [Tetrapyrgos nigripes]|uniref:Uncharacterized protein n=1 Tax=Tetrapyrgos nigripes TaxID=182062 RepID=A0A8H5LR15_9AGAR|nr:hypothetical protein D9758_005792 [Tetrapyrgos nigripes]